MPRPLLRRAVVQKVQTISTESTLDGLASEFALSKEKIANTLRGVGIRMEGQQDTSQIPLYREIIACKLGELERFSTKDEAYTELLDEQLRSFEEVYVDTAPILQQDWFLRFAADAEPILRRRKKKLIILEKTMEELHGLKDNPEKDLEVRIRAAIRPEIIRRLAKHGVVRIGDTGSRGIADDHLVSLFRQLGQVKSLLLITQDRGLSERIVHLAHELEKKKPEAEQKLPWYKKLLRAKQKAPTEQTTHQMVVCKLTDCGKLKRCYVCPECNESYYDDLHACEGVVLCGRCYLKLKEQESKQVEENRKKREAELKAEEERQRKLEEEERLLEMQKKVQTVEQRIEAKVSKLTKQLILAVVILISILIIILY